MLLPLFTPAPRLNPAWLLALASVHIDNSNIEGVLPTFTGCHSPCYTGHFNEEREAEEKGGQRKRASGYLGTYSVLVRLCFKATLFTFFKLQLGLLGTHLSLSDQMPFTRSKLAR